MAIQTAATFRAHVRKVAARGGISRAREKQLIGRSYGVPTEEAMGVAREAAETAKKEELKKIIQRKRQLGIIEATREYERGLREVKSLADRRRALDKYQRALGQTEIVRLTSLVQAGIRPKAEIAGITITPGSAPEMEKLLRGEKLTRFEVAELERAGLEFRPTGVQKIELPKEPGAVRKFLGKALEKYYKVAGKVSAAVEPGLEFPIGRYIAPVSRFITPTIAPKVLAAAIRPIKVKQIITAPAKVIRFAAEFYGKEKRIEYEKKLKLFVPEKYRPFLPSPKVIEKIAAAKIGVAPYFIPGAPIPLLVSELAYGLEKPSATVIERELEKQYRLHKETPLETGQEYYTKEEFKTTFREQVKTALTQERLATAGIAAGLITTIGVAKGISFLRKPIKVRTIGGEITRKAVEFRVAAKPPIGTYAIVTRRAPTYVRYTTRARELAKILPRVKGWPEPITKLVSPEKYWVTYPAAFKPVVGKRGYWAVTKLLRKGKPIYPRYEFIKGIAKPVTRRAWPELPKPIQYVGGKMLKVYPKQVPVVLAKPKKIVVGEILGLKPAAKIGKRIAEYRTVTFIERLGKVGKIRVYKYDVGLKALPKPMFARAAGEPPLMKGVLYELPKPTAAPPVIKGLTFERFIPKPIKPFVAAQLLLPKLKVLPAVVEVIPKVIPKIAKAVMKPMVPLVSARAIQVFYPTAKVVEEVIPKERLKVVPAIRPVLEEKLITKPVVKVMPMFAPAVIPKLAPKLMPKLIVKPALKLVPAVIPKLAPVLVPKPAIPKPPLPEIFFKPVPIPKRVEERLKKAEVKALKKLAAGYRLWVKREKKVKVFPKLLPKAEAIIKGIEITGKTLAATFGLIPTKEVIAVKRELPEVMPSPLVYRPYEIKKGVKIPLKLAWIQRAKYRLAAKEEVAEIIRARKVKRKKGGRVRWL